MRDAILEQTFSMAAPSSDIHASPDLHAKVVGAELLYILADQTAHPSDETRQPCAKRMSRLRQVRDHVLRARGTLDVGEEEDPTLGLEPASELSCKARFAHAALAGQQHVVAGSNAFVQYPQLRLSIKEVRAAHPAARG